VLFQTAPPGDCFTPAQPAPRGLDAHRAVRYDALLELIDLLQRRRSIDELAQATASRWKHFASVGHWRLLAVNDRRCVLITVAGGQVQVEQLDIAALAPYDAALWHSRTPRRLEGAQLEAERPQLPGALAAADGLALHVWPVQQGSVSIGMLSLLSFEATLAPLDRKFIGLVAAALSTRIVAILTEQDLAAERLAAERLAMEQRQATILGRLVNGVAHELNTPLGVLLSACGSAEALLDELAMPDAAAGDLREALQLQEAQARRAAHIVRRLKQISAAAQASPHTHVQLAEELHSLAAIHTRLNLQFAPLPDISVSLDRNALATVLGELLDNVRAHAAPSQGLPTAHIAVEVDAAEVRVQVQDTGPGLSDVQAARLFEPFHSTLASQGHMGIGGYIARSVAKDGLGGDLTLQTAPGCTCLTLHLPRTPQGMAP
jgi:signal transduction histidine kinase